LISTRQCAIFPHYIRRVQTVAQLTGKELELEIDGQTYQVRIDDLSEEKATVTVNGRTLEVAIHSKESEVRKSPDRAVRSVPTSPGPAPAQSPRPAPSSGKNALCALMPGVVVRLVVTEGQEVAAGDILLILEAMKMENEIRSDRAGMVGKIHVAVGQQVQTGDPLLSFS
jgi:biotin carboxyl carrier protein